MDQKRGYLPLVTTSIIPADSVQFAPLFCEPAQSSALFSQKRLRKLHTICYLVVCDIEYLLMVVFQKIT